MSDAFLKSQPGVDPIMVEGAFRAPIEKVWRAWTEPERMIQWFGGKAGDFRRIDADVRVGGRWRCEMDDDEAADARIEGVYLTVELHARLEFTWSHVRDFADGRREATPESTVSVTFRATEGGTTIALTHADISTEDARKGVGGGWAGSFERLKDGL